MLVWFDDDSWMPLPMRVERAASYYEATRGRRPTVMLTHKKDKIAECVIDGVAVQRSSKALQKHFFVGTI